MKSNKNFLISVVVPTYNSENTIRIVLEAIAKQTYPNIELIIVDNCSSDKTLEIAKSFLSHSTLKNYYIHQNSINVGPYGNWKIGIRLAKGHYIKLLFSDDLLLDPTSLCQCVNHFDSNSAFVISSAQSGYEYNEPIDTLFRFSRVDAIFPSSFFFNKVIKEYSGFPKSPAVALFRRSDMLNAIRSFDIKYYSCRTFYSTGAGPDLYFFLFSLEKYSFFSFISTSHVFLKASTNSLTFGSKTRDLVKRSYMQLIVMFLYDYMPLSLSVFFTAHIRKKLLRIFASS